MRVGITTELNLELATPGCLSYGGGRRPTPEETQIFTLWATRGLNDAGFAPGNLLAFFAHLGRLL